MKHLVLAFVLLMSVSLAVPDAASQDLLESVDGQVCVAEERYYIMPESDKAGPYCGRGVPAANVTLHAAAAPDVALDSAMTDENGMFQLDAVVAGDYIVKVQRAGFAPLTQDIVVPTDPLVLQPKPLEVTQAGRVAGDRPVRDAHVSACCLSEARTVTGPDGTFRLQVLAGWHSLYVSAPGHYEAHFDRFLDGAAMLNLTVKPLPSPDAYIHGTVRDQDGAPVAGAAVHTFSYGDSGPDPRPMDDAGSSDDPAAKSTMVAPGHGNRTTTGPDGTYRIGVMAGHVSVGIDRDGFASAWFELDTTKGADVRKDVELLRYPERTARLEGRITDPAGNGLAPVSVQVESPLYGRYECSTSDAAVGGTTEAGARDPPQVTYPEKSDAMTEPYDPGCAIQVQADGTFSGLVTPGYSIVRVHYQEWQACDRRSDSSDCQGYIPYIRTMDLPADATTRLDIELAAKPRPTAEVSGYLVDPAAEAGPTGIPEGHLSFSRLDAGGYGWAATDKDGSYTIRLHPGTYEVYAWADGYLAWAGMLDVAGSRGFDIAMTAGGSGRGCCMPMPLMESADGAKTSGAPAPSTGEGMAGTRQADSDYEDLGGGLGPYDPASRRDAMSDGGLRDEADTDVPAAHLVLLLSVLLLGAVAVRRRR